MHAKTDLRTNYRIPSPAAVAGGGLALVVLVIGALWLAESPERVRTPLAAPAATAPAAAAAAPMTIPQRPALVYRHSVIPGGVRDAAELSSKLARDPVASAHYAGFDVAGARLVKVEKARLVHVSYRIGDKIYWTRNRVTLAAGEDLLTDGTQLVRARCGNRIADTPQGMVLDQEPAPEALDTLLVSADGLLDDAGGLAPGLATGLAAAPAATRLASSLHGVTAPSARAIPDPAYMDTALNTALGATRGTALDSALSAFLPVPAQSAPASPTHMAPALVNHGDGSVPAAADTDTEPTAPLPTPKITTPSDPFTPANPSLLSPPSLLPSPLPLPPPSLPPPASPPADVPADTAAPVPESGTSALAILALIALALVRRGASGRR